jgi:hypothetical protein
MNGWMMNWKGFERKRSWPNLRLYPGIFLEGLRKTMKNLRQDIRSPSRDLSPGPPEYEVRVLTARPRLSIPRFQVLIESFMTYVDPREAHSITPITYSPRKLDNFRDTILEFQSNTQTAISSAFFFPSTIRKSLI